MRRRARGPSLRLRRARAAHRKPEARARNRRAGSRWRHWLLPNPSPARRSIAVCSSGECRPSVRHALQPFDFLRSDDELLLLEAALEELAEAAPPGPVEIVRHDFVDDDVVAPGSLSVFRPEPLCRCATVRGEAAEPIGELLAHR